MAPSFGSREVGTASRPASTVRAARRASALLCLAASSAWAGGHLDVDDSGTLDPGRCQYEAWFGRIGPSPATRVQHFDAACRVGPVELGLNIDRLAVPGDRAWVLGPQLKWTFWGDADSSWSAALSTTVSVDVRRSDRRPGGQLLVPITWHPEPRLWVHANYGADWSLGSGARTPRGGLGMEWAFHDKLSLIAERYRASGVWSSRAGLRYSLTPLISIDLTGSRTTDSGQRVRGVVLGLNHEFGRP